jgi:membrane-bound metal-dependent hydrolase YbcI (DUF457 family)
MNRRRHIVIGLLAFALYSWVIGHTAGHARLFPVYGIAAVTAGSLLPDLIEPATSANHRGLFHSRGMLYCMVFLYGATALMMTGIITKFPAMTEIYTASCLLLGYTFHLLADSLTPRGLPE